MKSKKSGSSQNANLRIFSYLVNFYISGLREFHFNPGSCFWKIWLFITNESQSHTNYFKLKNDGFHLRKVNCNHNLPG